MIKFAPNSCFDYQTFTPGATIANKVISLPVAASTYTVTKLCILHAPAEQWFYYPLSLQQPELHLIYSKS